MSFVPSCLLSLVLQYGILAHAQTFEQNAVTLSLPTTNGATETLEDYNAPVLLPLSPPGHLITLTRLIDGGSTYVPVGRSYAGHDWENVPGPEEKLQYLCDGEGSERKCQVFLRSDEEFTYQLTTYNHSLSPRNEIARFLERVSFGPTTATPSSSPTTAIPTLLQSSSLPSTATPSGSPPSTATPSSSPTTAIPTLLQSSSLPSTATPSGSPPSTATPSVSPPESTTVTVVLTSIKMNGASNENEACSISNEIGQSSCPNNSIIVQETCTVESPAYRRRRLENTILVLSTFSITSDSTTDQSTITNVFAQNINNINTNTVYDGISLQVLTVKQVIDFDFTIDFDSNCTDIQFNDARSAEELHFCFIIADKPADLKLYTKDCQTNISSESIIFNDITRKDSILVATRDVYEVNLDVIQGLIQSDDAVWTYDAAAMKGMIEFCMRMDLYADAARTQSVNFLEVLASIEVDMTTGFDVVSISTDRDAATNETATAKVNYTLNSYQCESADGGSSSLAMSQGSVLGLCIDLADDTEGVELDKVWGLSLNQTNGGSSSPIESGEVNRLTTSACTYNGGKRCFIETMLISAFFEKDAENADIVAQGTVLLKFGRRRLEARLQFDEEHIEKEFDESELAVQSKQEDPSPEKFLVIISTQGAVREDIKGPSSPEVELNNGSIAIGGVSVGLLVLFVGCFGLVAYLRHKKKKTDQQEKIGVPVDDSAELMPFT